MYFWPIFGIVEPRSESQAAKTVKHTVGTFGAMLKKCALQFVGADSAQDLERERLNSSEDLLCGVEKVWAGMRLGEHKKKR